MVSKTIYVSDKDYSRYDAIGKKMQENDSKVKDDQRVAKAMNECLKKGLPIVEKHYKIPVEAV